MSFPTITTANGIMPQFATNPLTGQIYIIAQNHQQLGFPYYLPRTHLENPANITYPQSNQRVISQQVVQQTQEAAPSVVATTKSIALESSCKLKDQTNASLRNIKEKCLSHFIEGQLIIETSKPLGELTRKSKQKKVREDEKQKRLEQYMKRHPDSRTKTITPTSSVRSMPLKTTLPPPLQPPQQTVFESEDSEYNTDIQHYPDDIKTLRADMNNWSVGEVATFIESHEDIRQYSSKFTEDEVDGKALLLMIDRNLNLQTLASMFRHGPAMKIEAVLSKYKLTE